MLCIFSETPEMLKVKAKNGLKNPLYYDHNKILLLITKKYLLNYICVTTNIITISHKLRTLTNQLTKPYVIIIPTLIKFYITTKQITD